MKTAQRESIQTESFEISAQLSFSHIFQSAPFWHGVGYGFMPQLVQELRSSQHKKSYLLSFGQRLLVLSVALGSEPFFDVRRQQVNPIISQVFKAGIGPALVYSSPEKGFVVSEYLEGRCWQQDDFQRAGNIQRIAQVLKQLHALPPEGHAFLAGKAEQCYWSEIRRDLKPIPKRLHALQLRMQQVISHAQTHYREQAVCHNNLHAANVLESEQTLRFVSWENAAVNDPYYDLAVLAYRHDFDDVQIDLLLFHYAGQVGDEQRQHFYYNYAICIYLDALRCVAEQGEHPSEDDLWEIDMHINMLHSVLNRLGA